MAAHGYDALTVRALARRARISSGAFYTHYRSTDDCLLSTFDLICRRTSERLVEAALDEPDPRRRLTLALDRLFRDIAAAPEGATFMLRAAPAAGPVFTDRLRGSSMRLGAALDQCLGAADGLRLPAPLLEGVVAGLARIGRVSVVAASEEDRIGELAAETAEWILSLRVPAAPDFEPLRPARVSPANAGASAAARFQDGGSKEALGDDRAMILVAAFRLARDGYQQLSVPRICREAGVSRRNFNRHFHGVQDCIFSAVEERLGKAVAASARRRPDHAGWSAAVYDLLETLCDAVEADLAGARVLFVETFEAGTQAIDRHDRLISQLARTVRTIAPEGRKPSDLAAEASTAAGWSILRRRVAEPGAAAAAGPPPSLSFLLLAPTIGSQAALRAVDANRAARRR